MTSEICVMNRRAIVLAADSAVTVTRWEGGQKEERYFKGANKIFQLSNFQPIGLMIFDTADLHRVPWEIVVKEFRTQLGSKKCGSLSGYLAEFFEFIRTNTKMFAQEYRDDVFVEIADQIIIRHLLMAQEDDAVKSHPDGSEEYKDAFVGALNSLYEYISSRSVQSPLTQEAYDRALSKHGERLCVTALDYLKLFKVEDKFPPNQLVELAVSALFKAPDLFTNSTGIVIGGYADEAIFPSYEEYTCGGFVADELFWRQSDGYQITPYDQGMVKAFATTAMVNTFTLGFAPDVFNAVTNSLDGVLSRLAIRMAEVTGQAVPDINQLLADAANEHRETWTRAVFEQHAAPLRRVVGSLPIDEMADLAETLIGLESLKEKVTQPSESVGGPIDVAAISKAEGFVWIKRKHYFDSAINPRYEHRQKSSFSSPGRSGDAL